MSIAIVQSAAVHSSSAATQNISLPAAVTAGNKLIVVGAIIDGTRTLLSPTGSGTWDAIDHTVGPSGGSRIQFYEKEAVGNETTVTVATSDAVADTYSVFLLEVSVLLDANAKDQTTNPASASAAVSKAAGTITPTVADELILACCILNGSYTTPSWGGVLTLGESTVRAFLGYKITTTTDPVSPTATWVNSRTALAGMVSFKQGTPPAPASIIPKVWNGSTMVSAVPKRWTGAAWA